MLVKGALGQYNSNGKAILKKVMLNKLCFSPTLACAKQHVFYNHRDTSLSIFDIVFMYIKLDRYDLLFLDPIFVAHFDQLLHCWQAIIGQAPPF